MDDRCFRSLRLSATLAGGIAMLLRSASTPLLNRPWAPAPDLARGSDSAELQVPKQIPRRPSVTHLASCSFSLSASPQPPISRCRSVNQIEMFSEVSERLSSASLLSHILTSSGLEGRSVTVASPPRTGSRRHTLFEVGDGGASGGCSGDDRGREGGNNSGSDAMDAYYTQMIKTDPGNSLLLGNYAKYLKEVRGDNAKAEEYCGRAMLANPHDPAVLTMYADLVWEGDRDAPRAKSYFDRAMKVAPDDCFVMASYAKFLWDSEHEDGEGGVRESSFNTAAARERIAAS